MLKMMLIMMLFFICVLSLCDLCKTDVALEHFSDGNRKFTADIYGILGAYSNYSLVLSPLSAQILLSLTAEGARNRTATQLVTALHLPNKLLTDSAIKQLNFDIKTENFTLLSANKMYVAKNFALLQSYLQISIEKYKSDVENVDFSRNQEAAKLINNWVEQHTNKKIHDILDPNSLSASTPLVLVNTLYINAKWKTPFNHKLTTYDFFHLNDSATRVIPMMNLYNRGRTYFKFFSSSELGADSLQLDLQNSNLSMTFILPHERNGLKGIERSLNVFLELKKYKYERVAVSIPRFETTSDSNDLRKVLEQLGVTHLFDPSSANLSGISNQMGLAVDSVVQKAFIKVTESGVDAAAATITGFTRNALLPLPTLSFKADHAFAYFISDRTNGIVYFVGRYTGL